MARTNKTNVGNYNHPAQILKPSATWVDNGEGGNLNANQFTLVRSPMIHLYSANSGRGVRRSFQYGQLYPTANHWAEFRYAHDAVIDATMILMVDNRRFEILGAIDQDLEHVITLLALVEYQARGST